jgi:hypothetical protein
MKTVLGLVVCAISLLTFASTAHSGGAEASGDFAFALGTAAGTVHFAGHIDPHTGPTGQITLNATVDVSGEECHSVPVQSGDNTILVPVCEPIGEDTENGAFMSQETVTLNFLIDRMVVVDGRAAMSGTINDESPFNGLHTILTVEDAGGNDGFTWGIYKTKLVNTNAKDFEFCYRGYVPPDDCGELNICPVPSTSCFAVEGPPPADDPGAGMTWTASDYELCPYPPNNNTQNNVPPDPRPGHYTCYTGALDPHGKLAGIPVEATLTITDAESFPLSSYPLTPVPNGGGNKIQVKDNS